ncbi:MAG: phenylacetic acid degradation protein, partial [Anaerolineae bacterium]
MPDTQWPLWEVFKQDKPDKAHESVGTVHAPDAEMALLNAR